MLGEGQEPRNLVLFQLRPRKPFPPLASSFSLLPPPPTLTPTLFPKKSLCSASFPFSLPRPSPPVPPREPQGPLSPPILAASSPGPSVPQFLGLPWRVPKQGGGELFRIRSWGLSPGCCWGSHHGWVGTLGRRGEPAAPPWACRLQRLSSPTACCPLLARAAPA